MAVWSKIRTGIASHSGGGGVGEWGGGLMFRKSSDTDPPK